MAIHPKWAISPEMDIVPDMTFSPNCAYGVHPLNNTIVEFDNVTVLRNTIIEWYKLIDENQLWNYLPNGNILFCINEMYTEGVGNVQEPTSYQYPINVDGLINEDNMARTDDCHFDPCISRIVIPRSMYTEYIIRYKAEETS
jgi:hypothetical protein